MRKTRMSSLQIRRLTYAALYLAIAMVLPFITGQIPDHIGPVCQGSYSVQQVQTGINIVTDKEAYDEETVVRNAWDEIVVDQEARDEVITAGYRCSTCGEMKES